MLSILSALLISTSLASPVSVSNACPANLPFGNPTISQITVDICHTGYYSAYNEQLKIPMFVAWPLTSEHAMGCIGRVGKFQHDPLEEGRDAAPQDYNHSGYDRGHLADDGDFGWDATESRESFYMTNMTPQHPNLNRGMWKVVEELSRVWASTRGKVIIYAGPIVDTSDSKLSGVVDVPSSFWKVVYDPKTNEAAAFIMPNANTLSAQVSEFVVSVDKIEKAAGITVPLPASFDKHSPTDLSKWPADTKKWSQDKRAHCAANILQ